VRRAEADGWLDELSHNYRPYIAGLVAALELEEAVSFMVLEPGDARLSAFYSALDLLIHPTNSPDETSAMSRLRPGSAARQRWRRRTAA